MTADDRDALLADLAAACSHRDIFAAALARIEARTADGEAGTAERFAHETAGAALAARPLGTPVAPCGHGYVLGDVAYTCERAPHPAGGYLRLYRHAAAIDAGHAKGTDEDDGWGAADLMTWGEGGQGDGQDWEVAWGSIQEWLGEFSPVGLSQPARAARAAFLGSRDGDRLGSAAAWNAAVRAAVGASRELAETRAVAAEMIGTYTAMSLVGGPTKGDMVSVVGRAQLARWHKRAGLKP